MLHLLFHPDLTLVSGQVWTPGGLKTSSRSSRGSQAKAESPRQSTLWGTIGSWCKGASLGCQLWPSRWGSQGEQSDGLAGCGLGWDWGWGCGWYSFCAQNFILGTQNLFKPLLIVSSWGPNKEIGHSSVTRQCFNSLPSPSKPARFPFFESKRRDICASIANSQDVLVRALVLVYTPWCPVEREGHWLQ